MAFARLAMIHPALLGHMRITRSMDVKDGHRWALPVWMLLLCWSDWYQVGRSSVRVRFRVVGIAGGPRWRIMSIMAVSPITYSGALGAGDCLAGSFHLDIATGKFEWSEALFRLHGNNSGNTWFEHGAAAAAQPPADLHTRHQVVDCREASSARACYPWLRLLSPRMKAIRDRPI